MYNLIGQKQLSSRHPRRARCQSVSDSVQCHCSKSLSRRPFCVCPVVLQHLIFSVNVLKSNTQMLPVVVGTSFCPWFNFFGMVRGFLNSWPQHEVQSRVPDDADIWSRCIKMAPAKFDVFMFFFTHHFINAKCPNFSERPCQMAQRWRWDSLAAGLHMLLDSKSVFCTWLITHVLCY